MGRDAEAAFTTFVRERGLGLLRFATAVTGDRDQAEDVLQGALERAYGRWEQITERGDPEWYVRKTILNGVRDGWRSRQRRPEVLGLLPGQGEGTYLPFDEFVTRDAVRGALASLPQRQRVVLLLRYWEGLTEPETAELMGTSVGTVKSQAHRAMKTLRERLDPAEDWRESVGAEHG